MFDRRRCTAVLALALWLILLPGFATAGPLTSGSLSEDGFLSSWLGWLADGWRTLTGSGETTLGGLWEPSGVGIDPNGNGSGSGGGTSGGTTTTSPTAQDGSTSTAQEK